MERYDALSDDDQTLLARDRELIDTAMAAHFRWQQRTGALRDLDLLQQLLDEAYREPATEAFFLALGTCLGDLWCAALPLAWVRYVDDEGADLALRYRETSIVIFARDMIIKRIEDGKLPHLRVLYDNLIVDVKDILASGEYV